MTIVVKGLNTLLDYYSNERHGARRVRVGRTGLPRALLNGEISRAEVCGTESRESAKWVGANVNLQVNYRVLAPI